MSKLQTRNERKSSPDVHHCMHAAWASRLAVRRPNARLPLVAKSMATRHVQPPSQTHSYSSTVHYNVVAAVQCMQ